MTIVATNITFTTQQLRENRQYSAVITVSNIAGSVTSEAGISETPVNIYFSINECIDTGTHDIQSLEARSRIDVTVSTVQWNLR